jgi:uncharacterized membrane protein
MRLPKEDAARIEEAIAKAAAKCSAPIRVHIQKSMAGDLMKTAVAKFNALGLAEAEARDGVLIFIASEARQFAIIADESIQPHASEGFWKGAVEAMRARFVDGDLIGGAVDGVAKVAARLAKLRPAK